MVNLDHPICVSLYELGDKASWNAYCDAHLASYASYAQWYEVLPRLGYQPLFLLARNPQGQIVGILPAAVSLLAGRRYCVSTWADGRMYAGPIADDATVAVRLVRALEVECVKLKVSMIRIIARLPEIESDNAISDWASLGYTPTSTTSSAHHYTFVLDLKQGFASIWTHLSGRDRSKYRKSVSDGLVIKEGKANLPLDMYYEMKRTTWLRLGNICPRREDMNVIYQASQLDTRWWSAWYEGKLVGALYCYVTAASYHLKGTVYDSDFPKLNINIRLYLDSIKSACEEGRIGYDFGSTPPPGSGHYAWKSKFGGEPHPIIYYEKTLSHWRKLLRRVLVRLTRPIMVKCSYDLVNHGM